MRISKLIKILICCFVILASLAIGFNFLARHSRDQLQDAFEQRWYFTLAARDFHQVSIDLTSWARQYAITGNRQAYLAYWDEIYVTMRREGAVAVFEELNAPQNEQDLIRLALEQDYVIAALDEQAFAYMAQGNADRAFELLFSDEYLAAVAAVMDTIALLKESVEARTAPFLVYSYASADLFSNLALLVSILFIIISILGVFIILRKIAPINGLMNLVSDVSDGNMSVNIKQVNIPKDEIGVLTHYIANLVEVVRNIIDDLNKLHHEDIVNGDIEYRIDASKYKNTFRELMQRINDIMDAQADAMLPAIEAISMIAEGDFNITINDLPGKKMILPQSLREVVSKLNGLYKAISDLAEKAAMGNINAHIDSDKFSGNWAVLADKLNNLMDAVAEPLADIERNVTIMAKGDFSHLDGTYPGTFGVLQEACNLVNDTTSALIKEISETLEKIANGDLTVKLSEKYLGSYAPIETSINTILKSLNSTLSDVKATVEQVTQGAEQISTSAMVLAEATMKQTASIEELSSSVMLVHEKASKASNDATAASESSERIQQHVTTGGEAIKSMEATMNKVKSSSQDISKIIDVISNIAFQTNLLALNASVEAARAGEHGKGFSVVADEVRNLAVRSQQSTSDTSEIIQEDLNHVDEGLKTTSEVVASFGTIIANVQEISGHISEIAEISVEQLESISNINASVSELTAVVTDISATAEESASASQELSSQAELLREKVAFFKLKA